VKKPNYVIPYGTQWIEAGEIAKVVDVLESDWLSPGPQLDKFELAFAKYCGSEFAVAFSSGTAALHGAMFAAGVKSGDEGVTSSFSWVASANCIKYQDGTPIFCDIDSETMNMSPRSLESVLSLKTKVIVPVHFAGVPCPMREINQLASKVGSIVVEDAAHALGSSYEGEKIGNCKYSDMTCFSFHPVKIITTGEGGMVTTNNPTYRDALLRFRTQGVIRNNENIFPDEGPWYFEMDDLGFNYRMTNFQAAIGIEQLNRIEDFLSRRQEIRNEYDIALKDLYAITIPTVPKDCVSSYHLYVIRLDLKHLIYGQKEIFGRLREKGLGVQVHYPPIHLQPYYRRTFGYGSGQLPETEKTYARVISLPIFPKMSRWEVEYVVDVVKSVVNEASR